jgi:pimeloyl-ACP methyl ester carboxylesterase
MNTITSSGSTTAHVPVRRKQGLGYWIGRILLTLLALLVGLATVGAAYQAIATERDKHTYPPPGQLVDVGGYKLHIHCVGVGSPTVILEAGLAGASAIWGWVQPEVARSTRVCAYDRAGVGWSDPGPEPRDTRQIAHELHTLLDNAGIASPYVLVGHSYGGLYVRAYADQYPNTVAGMVLVDSSHPDQWTRTSEGQAQYQQNLQLNSVAPFLARIGLLRLIDYFPARPYLPAQQAAELKAWNDSTQYLQINRAEFQASSQVGDQVRSTNALGALPLMVLTATEHGASTREPLWQTFQTELAALSTNRSHRVVAGADHDSLLIKQGDAQITSAAIRDVVTAVRMRQPLAQ